MIGSRKKLALAGLGALLGLGLFPPILTVLVRQATRLMVSWSGPGPYPAHQFDSDGVGIRYLDAGQGTPVILIHGFGWAAEPHWVAPGLFGDLVEAGYRAVAYDARGHGGSDKPHDPAAYGMAEVRDVLLLMDHLGISAAYLVGYSRGAAVAQAVRAIAAERVHGVVLGGFGQDGGTTPLLRLDPEAAVAGLRRGDLGPLIRALHLAEGPLAPWKMALVNGRFSAVNDMAALAAAFQGQIPPSSLEQLRENQTPTLALVGDADAVLPAVRAMERVMADLEVRTIPGADHASAITRPELRNEVLAFLSRTALPPR